MKSFRKFQAALLAFGMALSGISLADWDIIDGEVVAAGDPLAEFTVMVRNTDQDPGVETFGLCTGTLITSRIVLTAAHCVLSPQHRIVRAVNKISVVFHNAGVERLDNLSPGIEADMVMAHGGYFENDVSRTSGGTQHYDLFTFKTHDLALIRLKSDAPAGTKPLQKFASRTEINQHDDTLTYAGYGNETANLGAPTGRLKSARVNLASNNRLYSYIETTYRTGLAMGGDSGGPLLIKHPTEGYKLAGVHSTGPDDSAYRTNEVTAVRIADYEEFMRESLTDMGANSDVIYGPPAPPSSGSRWPRLGG